MNYRIITDPRYRYKRLEPKPAAEDLRRFYENDYFALLNLGQRAPGLKRLYEGGDAGDQEQRWREATFWADIVDLLREHGLASAGQPRLVDVGCGTGHFVAFFHRVTGYPVAGIEPSIDAARQASALGIPVYSSIKACREREDAFQAVTLLNVLEHVAEPVDFLEQIGSLLTDGGLLVVMVPNDFSVLQEVVQAKLGKGPWWVAIPDHVNYFTFDSLAHVLEQASYEVLDRTATFPMEFFLAFGEDYVGNPEIGRACHAKRVQFELTLPKEVRRALYKKFAELGIGRHIITVARRLAR